MAWCDGLPAFRLVSRRPPNALPNRSPNDVSIIALMFIIAVIVNVRQGWRSNIVFLLADHIGGTLQIFLLRYLQSKYWFRHLPLLSHFDGFAVTNLIINSGSNLYLLSSTFKCLRQSVPTAVTVTQTGATWNSKVAATTIYGRIGSNLWTRVVVTEIGHRRNDSFRFCIGIDWSVANFVRVAKSYARCAPVNNRQQTTQSDRISDWKLIVLQQWSSRTWNHLLDVNGFAIRL